MVHLTGRFKFAAMLAIVALASTLLMTPASAQCTGICYFITSPYLIGSEIAAAAVILVITVLAVLYMLSPMIGTTQMRVWIRTKVYDEFASLIFILVFVAFGGLVATMPVYNALNSVGLVNLECTGPATQPPMIGQTSNDNLYFMSLCDVYQFNNDTDQFALSTFYIASAVSFAPLVNVNVPPSSGGEGLLPGVSLATEEGDVEIGAETPEEDDADSPGVINTGTFAGGGVGVIFQFNTMPIQPVFHYFVPLLNTLYLFNLLSQVQLLLIAASGFIFAILMAVGLVARSFGITRTFGGAMIAFALGIGVVYPIMTVVTYGFITHAIDNARTDFVCAFSFGASENVGIDTCPPPYNDGGVFGLVINMVSTWFTNTFNDMVSGNGLGTAWQVIILQLFVPIFRAYILYGGLVAIGLSFIPLLNLTIVDVFIVDFSLAIGERMDFLSLLTRLV